MLMTTNLPTRAAKRQAIGAGITDFLRDTKYSSIDQRSQVFAAAVGFPFSHDGQVVSQKNKLSDNISTINIRLFRCLLHESDGDKFQTNAVFLVEWTGGDMWSERYYIPILIQRPKSRRSNGLHVITG